MAGPGEAARLAAFAAFAAAGALAAGAAVLVTERAEFAAGSLPEGWTADGEEIVSPAYPNALAGASVAYGAARAGASGTVSLFAVPRGGGESVKVADVGTAATGASFSLDAARDFRSFRIATNGVSLSSFEATWITPSVMAVSASVVAGETGYVENFDALTNLPTESVWENGVTLPYWQASNDGGSFDKIKVTYGAGNKSGGLYAFRGTNKNVRSHFSLAAVATSGKTHRMGFAVANDTGFALTNFNISFTARQFTFTAKRTSPQSMTFEYLVTNEVASVAAEGAWSPVDDLKFDAVASLEAGGPNSDLAFPCVATNMCHALSKVRLGKNDIFVLRWSVDGVASGDALGIDDVVLTCDPPDRKKFAVYIVKASPVR